MLLIIMKINSPLNPLDSTIANRPHYLDMDEFTEWAATRNIASEGKNVINLAD